LCQHVAAYDASCERIEITLDDRGQSLGKWTNVNATELKQQTFTSTVQGCTISVTFPDSQIAASGKEVSGCSVATVTCPESYPVGPLKYGCYKTNLCVELSMGVGSKLALISVILVITVGFSAFAGFIYWRRRRSNQAAEGILFEAVPHYHFEELEEPQKEEEVPPVAASIQVNE